MSDLETENYGLRIVNPFQKSIRIEITGPEYKETIIAGPKETVSISLEADIYNVDARAVDSGEQLEWRHVSHQVVRNLPKAEEARSLAEMLREMEEEANASLCNGN